MKKALLVGINSFKNPQFNLNGCVNDVDNLKSLLIRKYAFQGVNITTLIDAQASRVNIIQQLEKLIQDSAPGDVLVFGVSTHGTQRASTDASEPDKKDEAIVPWEASYSTLITDNQIHDIVTARGETYLEKINFTGIYDLCHSGTMVREIGLVEDEFEPLFVNRCIDLGQLIHLSLRDATLGPYNSLSACLDEQTAADLRVEGIPRGAFSYALHKVLEQEPNVKVADLEQRVLEVIRTISTHNQTPVYYEGKEESRVFAAP
jgi:metacaspase-1